MLVRAVWMTAATVWAATRVACGAEPIAAPSLELAADIEETLWWLPEDTETLIVSRGPFHLETAKSAIESADMFRWIRSIATSLVEMANEGALTKALRSLDVELVVQGSRDFRWPNGVGSMLFDGAEVIRFASADDDELAKALNALFASAAEKIVVAGHRVAVLHEHPVDDDWTIYVARLESRVLVVASQIEYLRSLLERREKRPPLRAFPNALNEWRHVETHADVWGMRHYRSTSHTRDLTSPRNPQCLYYMRDERAVGLTFWCEERSNLLHARYLSGTGRVTKSLLQSWNVDAKTSIPRLSAKNGVVEIIAPLSGHGADEETLLSVVLALLRNLGHGLVI